MSFSSLIGLVAHRSPDEDEDRVFLETVFVFVVIENRGP